MYTTTTTAVDEVVLTISFWNWFGQSPKSTVCFESFKGKNDQKKRDKKKLVYLDVLATAPVQLFAKVKEAWEVHYNSFWKAEMNLFATAWR